MRPSIPVQKGDWKMVRDSGILPLAIVSQTISTHLPITLPPWLLNENLGLSVGEYRKEFSVIHLQIS